MQTTTLPILRENDRHGLPIVKVPIRSRKGTFVTLDAPDYDRLLKQGVAVNTPFVSNNGSGNLYVRVSDSSVTGSQLTLARLISGTGARQAVYYNDHDPLNLRQHNLRVGKGLGKRDDRLLAAMSVEDVLS